MEAFKLTLLLISRDKKNVLFYLFSSILSFSILFSIFNVIFDPNLISILNQEQYIILTTLGLVVLFMIITVGYHSNSFFMDKRKKEFAVELVSGLSLNGLAFSIGALNFVISFISLIGAFIIGIVFSPLLNKFIYSFIGLENLSTTLTKDGIFSTCAMLLINILLLGLLNVGLGYRTEICNLIRSKSPYDPKVKYLEHDFSKTTNNIFKILSLCFIILLAFGPLVAILFTNDIDTIQIFIIISALGIFFFVFKLIPIFFELLSKNTDDKINTIVFKNLFVNIKKNRATLISILTISIFMLYFLGEYTRSRYLAISGIGISFLLIILFLLTSLYAFNSLGNLKLRNFKILFSLGFTKGDVEKIIFKESLLNTILICCLPFLLIVISILKLVLISQVNIYLATLILCVIILAILISFTGSYLLYKNKLKTIL